MSVRVKSGASSADAVEGAACCSTDVGAEGVFSDEEEPLEELEVLFPQAINETAIQTPAMPYKNVLVVMVCES